MRSATRRRLRSDARIGDGEVSRVMLHELEHPCPPTIISKSSLNVCFWHKADIGTRLAVSSSSTLSLQLHDSRLRYLTWIKFRVVAHALPFNVGNTRRYAVPFQEVASEE